MAAPTQPTVQQIKDHITAEIAAETARAKLHTDVGDNEGAVHHKSKAQVLASLLAFIG